MNPPRFRLAWRWLESGTHGTGPWSHRADVVEQLADTLNRRFHERMEHWVEAERDVRVPERADRTIEGDALALGRDDRALERA